MCVPLYARPLIVIGVGTGQQLSSLSPLALVAAGVGRTAVDVHGVVGWCPSTRDVGVVVIMTWPICRTSVTKCDMSAEKLLQLNCTPACSCRSEQVWTR